MRWLVIPMVLILTGMALPAETWLTFVSAYQDGLEAQGRGDLETAARAFGKAAVMAPVPGNRVKTYGLNFLPTYHPYLRLAEVFLAQGELAKAEAALARSQACGIEPELEREALQNRLRAKRQTAAGPLAVAVPAVLQAPPNNVPRPEFLKSAEPARLDPNLLLPPTPTLGSPTNPFQAKAKPAEVALPRLQAEPALAATTLRAAPEVQLQRPRSVFGPGQRWVLLSGGGLLLGGLGALWRRRRRSHPAVGVPLQAHQQRSYGPFQALSVLGQGGCATAYLGIHRVTGEAVALKVPHPHLVRDPEFRTRFRLEASLGSRLDHPRIVRILATSLQEDDPWLAMPFVRGITLEAHLRETGALPLAEALGIAAGLAEAIAYAHTRSVVHRDLKPSNIMLTEAGVMVMDFGIARVLDGCLTSSTLFLGTPTYAAPECVTTPQVGPPADRYAMGIILFEMLGGQPPFTGHSPFQILEAHCAKPLPDLQALRPEVPRTVVRFLERLCAKAPEARPEDGEVRLLLEQLLLSV